ncbi:MAG: hypothetical protein ACM3L9_05055, partial [Deltaproteobacteria bacterium]
MRRYRVFLSAYGLFWLFAGGLAVNPSDVHAQGIEFGPTDSRPEQGKSKKPAAKPPEAGATSAPATAKRQVPGPGTPNPLAAKYATSGLPPKPNPANCKNAV